MQKSPFRSSNKDKSWFLFGQSSLAMLCKFVSVVCHVMFLKLLTQPQGHKWQGQPTAHIQDFFPGGPVRGSTGDWPLTSDTWTCHQFDLPTFQAEHANVAYVILAPISFGPKRGSFCCLFCLWLKCWYGDLANLWLTSAKCNTLMEHIRAHKLHCHV